MTSDTREPMGAIFARLAEMGRTFDRRAFQYHLGFAGLIIAAGVIDTALRLQMATLTPGPLQTLLYAGFLGAASALIAAYGCFLIGIIGAVSPRQPTTSTPDLIRTGLLGAMVVVPSTIAGLFCCLFPGLIVACILAPVPVLVILHRYDVRSAISRSVEIARRETLTLLPVYMILTAGLLSPLLLDGVSTLVVTTAYEPTLWLFAIGPAVRWLSTGVFGIITIWALTATIPVLERRLT